MLGLQSISKHTKDKSCFGEATSSRSTDTKQHSQSREPASKGAAAKISGYNFQTSRSGRRGQRRGISMLASAYVGRSQTAEIIRERIIRTSGSSRAKPIRSSSDRTVLGKKIGRSAVDTQCGKGYQLCKHNTSHDRFFRCKSVQ